MSKECIHFFGPLCVYIYIYITSNKVVLNQYIHFILVYFEHNGDEQVLMSALLYALS